MNRRQVTKNDVSTAACFTTQIWRPHPRGFLRSGIGNDVENGEGSILVVFERKEMSEISILNKMFEAWLFEACQN